MADRRLDGAWERLCGARAAPARRERVVLAALAVYWLLWAAYGTISKAPQHLHTDMTELFAWSRDLALGYDKHPPLAAWLVRLWFSVFPVAEWSYYLLAMLMPVAALWIVWRLSADYLDDNKRVFGLAMLTLVPFFNFHALKFNVNTVLMPLWAAAIFFFLRSYRTRSAAYAALAGAAAGACMLGKYWSVFLLGGLLIAALSDSRRAAYFRSPAPWIAAAIGVVVMSPNLVWLAQNSFKPLLYAANIYSHKTLADSAMAALGYLTGAFAYALPPVLIVAATRPPAAALADTLWPADRERRLVAAVFWASLLLPPVVAVTSGTNINPLWSMSAWTLLPVLLLSPPAVTFSPIDTRRLLIGGAALPLLALAAAPAVAIIGFGRGEIPFSAQGPLLTAQIERSWHAVTPQPLRFVGGDAGLSHGTEFYSKERPRALPGLPQPAAELVRNGAAYVCFAEDGVCIARMEGRITTVTISNGPAGQPGATRHYAISVVPPQPDQ
jgi:4-amino-4-deoxy-L-arabinose transferase-like glycosyltransferase